MQSFHEYSLDFRLIVKPRVLSRHVILDHVWSMEDPPEENTVKVHIRSLRQKLQYSGAPNNLIETVHGIGYRLGDIIH